MMSSPRRLVIFLAVALLILLPASWVIAQETNATLTGFVVDSTGAVVPGARVTVKNLNTNLIQVSETNTVGAYSSAHLPPGHYSISVEQSGFGKQVTNVTLTVGQQASVDFRLQIGSQVQTVTVNESEELLNTSNAEISSVVSETTIKELPLNGRDPSSLIFLSPGVVNVLNTAAGYTQNSDSFGNETGVSAGGGQQGSTFALLDGVPNMDSYLGLTAPFPNADATEEFRATTNNFTAQYGFAPGAVINISTKAGTNQLHGGAFEFIRNQALNAANWFSGAKDTLKRNQFGGFVGGPVLKDKLFLFANYQGTRQSLAAQTNTAYTPTAAMLAGDFSAVPIALPAPFQTVNGIPNQVDPSLFSTAAVTIAKTALPLGQGPATGLVTFPGPAFLTSFNEGTLRIDFDLTSTQRLFARSFIQEFDIPAKEIKGNILAWGFNEANAGKYYNEVISHTWTPTSSFANVLTAAWTRMAVTSGNQVFDSSGQPFCLSRYINVVEPSGCFTEGFYVSNGFSAPWDEPNNNARVMWWLSDEATLTRGKHMLAVGLNLAHQWANTQTDYPAQPGISFYGETTGFGLADFLLGNVDNVFQGAFQNSPVKGWQVGIYAQDQYKLNPKLSVSAGLRWEPDLAAVSINSGAAFVPGQQSARYAMAPTGLVFPGDNGVNDAVRPSDYNIWEPRVGVTWQPRGPKTVFRTGFGIFVGPIQYSFYNSVVAVPPFSPFFNLNSYSAPFTGPISFQNPWSDFTTTGGVSPFSTPSSFEQNPNVPASSAVILTPISLPDVFARNFHIPRTQSWNVSVEHQINAGLIAHITYVGSETYHQPVQLDLNPGIFADGGNRTRFPLFSNITQYTSLGTTSYNSLQAQLEMSSWHGLQFQSNFTWSKTLDLSSNGSVFGHALPDPFYPRFNRGIADQNIAAVSTSNFVYTSPALRGRSAILREVAGSWEASGIYTVHTGQPFSIVGGDGNNNSGAQQYGDRADVVPGQARNVHQGSKSHWLNQYFNPAAFAINAPGTFGTSGRNILTGPGVQSVDLALMKNWQAADRYGLQFRVEMFNALNHPVSACPAMTQAREIPDKSQGSE